MRTCLLLFALFVSVLCGPALAGAACVQEVGGVLTSTLSWNNTDTTDPVTIFRASKSGGPYTNIGTVNPGVLTFIDTSVPAPAAGVKQSYFYVVQNISPAAGPSPNSNEVCKDFFGIPPAPVLSIQ